MIDSLTKRIQSLTDSDRLLIKQAAQRVYEEKLTEFIKGAWHVVEPGTPYLENWHIGAICEHLTAVREGHIRKLVITMPPRQMKSLSVSVFFPMWWWATDPSIRFLYASYAQSLSTRDSLKCRRIIDSRWYQERWGDVVKLTGDQNAKVRFENDRAGCRIATSVGGTATGEGGDVIITDDPNNIKEAESEAKLKAAVDWWDLVMSTRLNNPKTGSKIIVQQRSNEMDVAGHVLDQTGWIELRLPGEFEKEHRCVIDVTGFKDPRTKEGELLWPERMGPVEIAEWKETLGPYGYAGQVQQRPAPLEGGMFKRKWIKEFNWDRGMININGLSYPLKNCIRIAFIDPAITEDKLNDYTVMGIFAAHRATGWLAMIDQVRERMEAPALLEKLTEINKKWNLNRMYFESTAFQKAIVQIAKNDGLPILELEADRDKVARAYSAVPLWSQGRYYVPAKADWRTERDRELFRFPNAKNDDQVDVESYACNWWLKLTKKHKVPKPSKRSKERAQAANPISEMY